MEDIMQNKMLSLFYIFLFYASFSWFNPFSYTPNIKQCSIQLSGNSTHIFEKNNTWVTKIYLFFFFFK